MKIRDSSNNPSASARTVDVRSCRDFVHHSIPTAKQKDLVGLPPSAIETTHRVTVSRDFQPSPFFSEGQAPSGKQIERRLSYSCFIGDPASYDARRSNMLSE